MNDKSHHWPRRQFIRIRDECGVTVEPAGHDDAGEPLTEFYRSDTQETLTITEAEALELIDELKHPNRKY